MSARRARARRPAAPTPPTQAVHGGGYGTPPSCAHGPLLLRGVCAPTGASHGLPGGKGRRGLRPRGSFCVRWEGPRCSLAHTAPPVLIMPPGGWLVGALGTLGRWS